ncbi:hypothetical protein SAMN04244553_3607 [Nocardia amikacinitolerans]|uniref:Helix-turn-helix domain-containing protein n=1 Tax=Nocardia amikacinitolerans TaxID=756689 RepID=A0A285LGX7_9NOCA|nr:hypothetical protein [Nocardia amikacinitolerans]SNY84195.1 hypothetical protein SAMN04244553_3607 [Nocardia amikacinitolerans]
MTGHRNNLERAREIARAYRNALRAVDPERCSKLDEMARQCGQRWIAPTELPPEAVEAALEAILSPRDIAEFWGIPAATLYAWSSKGRLTNRGEPRRPKFLVSEVLAVEAEGRKRG